MSFLRFTQHFRPYASSIRTLKFNNLGRPSTMDSFFKPSHSLCQSLANRNFASKAASQATSRIPPGINSAHGMFYRHRNHYPTNRNIVYGLIALNCGVFCCYHYLRFQAQNGAMLQEFRNFVKNFTMNINTVKDEGRVWTLLTSCFTHFDLMHLVFNMISFYYMGKLLALTPSITPLRLVGLVLGSGISGSLLQFYTRNELNKKKGGGYDPTLALGFSGCVMGVGSVAACFHPRQKFAIYGIIPVPLWLLMTGYFVYDGFFLNSENSKVGHGGHVGGLLFGLAYFARLRFLTF